jgi:hypothetical protein
MVSTALFMLINLEPSVQDMEQAARAMSPKLPRHILVKMLNVRYL